MSSYCVVCDSTDNVSEVVVFFFQAEDGIRDLVRSRGLGDVYKRQDKDNAGISINGLIENIYRWQSSSPVTFVSDSGRDLSLIHI